MSVTICKPGDNINDIATSRAAGDTFILTTGTYKHQKVLPLDGQTFIGQQGVVLDGAATTDYCFYYDDAVRHPRGVTLRNLTIQNYTGGAGRGMIHGDNAVQWVLDHLTVTGCSAGRGIETGPGMILRSCRVTNNYLEGLSGFQSHGLCIEGCEFANNNTSHIAPDTATGAGSGFKLATCVGVRIRQTYSHDNYGPGIWLDIDCHDAQLIACQTMRNSHRGIQIEISDTVLVLDTVCINEGIGGAPPGAAGIFVSSSSNVEIAGCRFHQCQTGVGQHDDPARGAGPYGPRRLTNFNVHDNVEWH
jgi:hypothetical protein